MTLIPVSLLSPRSTLGLRCIKFSDSGCIVLFFGFLSLNSHFESIYRNSWGNQFYFWEKSIKRSTLLLRECLEHACFHVVQKVSKQHFLQFSKNFEFKWNEIFYLFNFLTIFSSLSEIKIHHIAMKTVDKNICVMTAVMAGKNSPWKIWSDFPGWRAIHTQNVKASKRF